MRKYKLLPNGYSLIYNIRNYNYNDDITCNKWEIVIEIPTKNNICESILGFLYFLDFNKHE